MANPITIQTVSLTVSQLMPHIIQGVHLSFLTKRTITQTQFMVLVAIYSYKRCMMTTLSQHMKVSMPTVSGIVDRLVKAGYVKRLSDSQDRRQVMVELTPKGQKFINQFKTVVSQRWQEVLKSISQEELESFYKGVKGLTEKLNPES